MKKITLLLLILASSNIFSQSGWEVIYPGLTTNGPTFKDIKFFDSQNGWVLGQSNAAKTTNGGVNWSLYIIVHQSNQLTCFNFYNKDIGWAGENNYLNFTSNAGTNWTVINNTISNPRCLFFKDLLTGWVCGDSGMIKKTTNSGFNWSAVPSGTGMNLKAIAFADDSNGICAGDWGTILSTTNGGANWRYFYDSYLGFFTNVNFKNSQTGFVTGTGNNIYKTTNSGANWIPYYVNSYIISTIKFSQNNTAYAFGSPGFIYNSSNYGNNWNQLPANGLFSQVNAASITINDNIWVAADSGLIYNSTNLGNSWNLIYRDYLTKEHLNSVYFIDQLTGFACGNKGILIKSVNGGTNWLLSSLGTEFSFKDIQFVNNSTGFIAGGSIVPNGIIYRTSNSGESWQPVYNDSSSLTSIHFIDPNSGWAAGSNGFYLKTTNSGINWVRNKFQTMNYNDIWFNDNNTGYLGGTGGFYRTTNSGTNWTQVSQNNTTSVQFSGSSGFAFTTSTGAYYLLKSTDLGNNWQQTQIPGGTFQKGFFVNEQTGWSITGPTVRKSTNGGLNWFIQTSSGNSVYVNGLYFLDNNYGWCVGQYGGIMRTITGGIGITQISTEIPKQFYLSQNYPNPFNPATKFKFQMPKTGYAKLIIYDITGREVEVMLNEHLQAGTYEAEWNAAEYSSGVYFYTLTLDNFTQTRKMVIIK